MKKKIGHETNDDRRYIDFSMESLTIELRQRIRSCNVFVSLKDGTDPNRVQVKLNKDFIKLKIARKSWNLCLSTIRIIPSSLSSLKIGGGWLSFRLQTTPIDSSFGSFNAELVGSSSPKNRNYSKSSGSTELPPINTDLEISCNCCGNVITKTLKLRKVLPLPDNDCEPAEWFCCSRDGDDYSRLLVPTEKDYFYGSFYGVLNRANFVGRLKIHPDEVVCSRCLTIIGVPHGEESIRMWNYCVEYIVRDDKNSPTTKKCGDPLGDFKLAVKSCIDDFVNERILLESFERDKKHYLLLKPMEWNLDLLVAPCESLDSDAISLEKRRVVKIFYDYGESVETRGNLCSDVKRCRIGLKCMLAGVEHLVASSKKIPPIYRNAAEFRIGYMIFDDLR